MKRYTVFLFLLIIIIAFTYCTKEWEEHYGGVERSVNIKMWDTLQTMDKYSEFIKYMKFIKLDTVIISSNTKTLFIPDNDAFNEYFSGDTTGFTETMSYHIVPTFYMLRNIEKNSSTRIKTLAGKFGLIQNSDNIFYLDGVEIVYSSQLYLDGKYYEIEQIVKPKPNLYEYIKWNNPALREYIDLQDTVILDREESKPIGFNEQGGTIYDSVTTVRNLYEEEYFAISEEYRDISATLILPDQTSYEAALDEMALTIGETSHEDIPVGWQNNVLIPVLFNNGTFGGLLEPVDFEEGIIVNIIGDSIKVDLEIDPDSRVICSNGVAYQYSSFFIGDTLYSKNILEAETLCKTIGAGKFSWIDNLVKEEGVKKFQPKKQYLPGASNDTIVNVDFENNYQQEYAISFKIRDILPQKYRLVWRTNYRTTGLYSIYVNGEKVMIGLSGVEEYDTYDLTSGFFSVLGYKFYPDERGYCNLDGWVENLTEFGDVTIKLEYHGPGRSSNNGLSIDYIALLLAE